MSSIMRRRRGLNSAIGGAPVFENWASTTAILADRTPSTNAHATPALAGSFNQAPAKAGTSTAIPRIELTQKGRRHVAEHAFRPRRKPLSITKARRSQVEAIVDTLLDLLDVLDGDADLEPNLANTVSDFEADNADDEPSLGWIADSPQAANQAGGNYFLGSDDKEGDVAELGIADSGALADYLQEEEALASFRRQTLSTDAAWSTRAMLAERGLRVPRGQRESRAAVITGPDGALYRVDREGLDGRGAAT
jgi:hypothetical protein